MNEHENRRLVGPRVLWASGAILLVLGGILLNIVGDPPRVDHAFTIGIAAMSIGCVLVLSGIEAVWLRMPLSISLRDGLRGLIVAALTLVGAGLLVQVAYTDQSGYNLLVARALPLVIALSVTYIGSRLLLAKLGV